MLSWCKWLVKTFLCLFGVLLVSSKNDIETILERSPLCSSLNFQANYTNCCNYPRFAAYMWQLLPCNEECLTAENRSCCVGKCCYVDKMGILNVTENNDESIARVEINLEPLVAVFLSTVKDDKKWEPVVRSAVKKCYDGLWGTFDGHLCGFIPNSFFPIVSCVYTENFLHCPVWNPQELPECGTIRNYVEKCFN